MRVYLESSGIKKSITFRVAEIVFWFSVIDIFFLPYISIISVSYSVPLIIIWMLIYNRQILSGKEGRVFLFLLFFMVVGSLISLIYPETLRWETTFATTLKRFFQYLISFGYYFFYREYFMRNRVNINVFLLFFCFVVTIIAVFFFTSPGSYAEIKRFINPVDFHTVRYLSGTHSYRFNYLWTDPNNIAYLMNGIVLWFVLDENETFKNRIIVLLLSTFIILATTSNSGMIILIIELILLFGIRIVNLNNTKLNITTLFGVVFFIIVAFVFINTSLKDLIQGDLFNKWLARLTTYSSSSNFSGGRLNDLKEAVTYLNPLLLFFGSGKEGFTSENGHLYWIGLYGVPAYLAFMYLIFGKYKNIKWNRYIWIFPFFFAFTFNIAIGEFKWFTIYLAMLAYSRYSL